MNREADVSTSAFTLFKGLSDIAQSIFSDVIQLRADHVSFSADCPYQVSDDDLNELCAPARWSIMKRIAYSPRFPWDLQRIIPAIEAGQRYVSMPPHARRLSRGNQLYRSSHMHVQQLMSHIRRMCQFNPHWGVIAFGLSQPEIRSLLMAQDAAFIEAATMIRLSFRTDHFRDVLRLHTDGKRRVTQTPIMEHIVGISGLGRARTHL